MALTPEVAQGLKLLAVPESSNSYKHSQMEGHSLLRGAQENYTDEDVDAISDFLIKLSAVSVVHDHRILCNMVAERLSADQAGALLFKFSDVADHAKALPEDAWLQAIDQVRQGKGEQQSVSGRSMTRIAQVLLNRQDTPTSALDALYLDGADWKNNRGLSDLRYAAATSPKLEDRHVQELLHAGDAVDLERMLQFSESPAVNDKVMHQALDEASNPELWDKTSLKGMLYSLAYRKQLPDSVRSRVAETVLADPDNYHNIVKVMSNRDDLSLEEIGAMLEKAKVGIPLSEKFYRNNKHNISQEDFDTISRSVQKQGNLGHRETLQNLVPYVSDDRLAELSKLNYKKMSPDHEAWSGEMRDAVRKELTWRSPDKAHKESVNVAYGTNKLRILRDKIGELGADQATPKELPPELVQAIGSVGRMPNGNYSAKLLQAAIDAAPRQRFNISHSAWNGAQRHSSESSKVFQVNLSSETADKLKAAGVYDTYRELWSRFNSGGHPIGEPGIGWVRWTGSKAEGIHIDELQSDMGQNLSKMLEAQAEQARAQGYDEADIQAELAQWRKDFPPEQIDKINEIVLGGKHTSELLMEAFHEWARTHKAAVKQTKLVDTKKRRGRDVKSQEEMRFEEDIGKFYYWYQGEEGQAWKKANPKKADKLEAIDEMFGQTAHLPFHSNKRKLDVEAYVLHVAEITGKNFLDASMARYTKAPVKRGPKVYESLVGTRVATWQPETKAPISGLSPDKPLPKHIMVGHRAHPEKMGFKPSIYGNLPTQSGDFASAGIGRKAKAFYEATGRDPTKGLPPEQTRIGNHPETNELIKVPAGAPTMEEEIRKNERFLEAVLGEPAAEALLKAAERSPVMATAMLPRAITAWLDFAGRWDYVGPIPGCPDTHIEFRKSEAGFEGIIEANEEAYEFHGAPLLEVAAAVGVALGWDIIAPSELLTKAQLDAVGGQMDLLVKATYLRKTQDKAGTTTRTPHAAPLAPDAPTASKKPKGPAMGGEAQATPIKPKSEECEKCTKTPCKCKKKVRVKKSQAAVECSVCGAAQWSGDTLTLCHCLRDLRKSVKSTEIHNGYEVEFGSNWAATDIQVFLDMVQE